MDRLELQAILEEVLGSKEVYFQPPANVRMRYPAIVYDRLKIDKKTADNIPYLLATAYSVTLIDPDPDSRFVMELAKLPRCSYERHYIADNLHHDMYTIYIS